jgi:hypothetical protein
MAIEFRVHDQDSATSEAVAQEFAQQMKVRFKITPVIRRSPQPADDPGVRFDPVGGAILVVEVALVAYHVYTTLRERWEKQHDALVMNWLELVQWAMRKLPTKIRAVIGQESLLLHESDPERLCELTMKALQSGDVIVEPESPAKSPQSGS